MMLKPLVKDTGAEVMKAHESYVDIDAYMKRERLLNIFNSCTAEFEQSGMKSLFDEFDMMDFWQKVIAAAVIDPHRNVNQVNGGCASGRCLVVPSSPAEILAVFGCAIPQFIAAGNKPLVRKACGFLTKVGRAAGVPYCQVNFLDDHPEYKGSFAMTEKKLGVGVVLNSWNFNIIGLTNGDVLIDRHTDALNPNDPVLSDVVCTAVTFTDKRNGHVYRASLVGYLRQSLIDACIHIEACKETWMP